MTALAALLLALGLLAPAAPDDRVLTHSIVVPAPVERAWWAFTTAEGLQSWAGLRVLTMDFRVGGHIETTYDAEAQAGDPDNIIHRILSYEPGRMYSGTFDMPPPFPKAREEGGHWSVTRFEPVDAHATRITLSMYGWGEGEDWDEAYAFFDWGNAYSLELLRQFFAEQTGESADGGTNGADAADVGDTRTSAPTEGDASPAADRLAEYAAILGAAEANLRAGDVGAARRWLDAAPEALRGWEWRHLVARADKSLRVFRAHDEAITGLDFSHRDNKLVTASADGTAVVWDLGTLSPIHRLEGHEGAVYKAVFTLEGRGEPRVITAGQDGTARVWDGESGRLLHTLWNHEHPVSAVAVDAPGGGAFFAASSYRRHADRNPSVEGIVTLWDYEDGERIATLTGGGHTPISAMAFSPRDPVVIAATWYSRVYAWVLHADWTGEPTEPLTSLAVSDTDDHVHLNDVAFSPRGERVATSDDEGGLFVWEAMSGEEIWSHHEHPAEVKALAWTPDGARLVTGCNDRILRVWDAGTGALLDELVGHRGAIGALVFDGDGTLWSADGLGVVRSWDVTHDRSWWEGESVASAYSLAFSPPGLGAPRLVIGTFDGDDYATAPQHLDLLDAATGERLWRSPELGSFPNALDWIPGGETVVVGLDDTRVQVWDVARGVRVAEWEGPARQVATVDASADGRRVVAGAYGGGLRVWDAATGAVVRDMDHGGGVQDVDLSADGSRLLSAATDGVVVLWSVEDGHALMRLEDHSGWATAAAFSPDGSQILTGDRNGGVRRFDAATGALLGTLAGHAGSVGQVAFSPDGTRLLAASRVVRVHDAASGRELLTLRPTSRHRAWECEFSPDGETIAWTEWAGPLTLFRAAALRDSIDERPWAR